MEFDEAKELAFLNALTTQNRRACPKPRQRKRVHCHLPLEAFLWLAGTAALIILAHTGAIPGWLMHLGTEILTFRFALGLGSMMNHERRM